MAQAQPRKQKILGDVKKARRSRALISTLVVALITVSIVAGVIILAPHNPVDTSLIDTPISTSLYNQITTVSNSTLATVGHGSLSTSGLTPESGTLLTSGGKPEVLYMGGDFCPYCAAERWSIVVALSKPGTWKSGTLTYMLSSDAPGEPYPDTPTFSFATASYTSSYISFVGVELSHRDHSPYQTPTQEESSLMSQYDPSSGIPFVDIGNQYVENSGSQYSPGILTGNWTQIASQLNDPNTSIAKAVDGAANYLISAICKIDGGNPSGLCSQRPTLTPIGANNLPPANGLNIILTMDYRRDYVAWRSFPQSIF